MDTHTDIPPHILNAHIRKRLQLYHNQLYIQPNKQDYRGKGLSRTLEGILYSQHQQETSILPYPTHIDANTQGP